MEGLLICIKRFQNDAYGAQAIKSKLRSIRANHRASQKHQFEKIIIYQKEFIDRGYMYFDYNYYYGS